MQRFKILHRTYYNYTGEITLGTHRLLLRPREDHELRIESFNLTLSPDANVYWHRDVEDNSVAIASFSSPTKQLSIEVEMVIAQFNNDPLDFVVSDYAVNYPFVYEPHDELILQSYRLPAQQEELAHVQEWLAAIWQRGESIQTFSLLQRIAEAIFNEMSYCVRNEPGVQSASETLAKQSGSCRDFACLFMEAARSLGLAARFVSGYLHAPLMSQEIGTTHAWAEVYLPGAGWKGWDPTTGKVAGGDHVAVAVSRLPESVPPVGGSFKGAQQSTLDVGVWVTPLD
ncbi:MAG: transglutaminase family protein [Halioglobus sp.]